MKSAMILLTCSSSKSNLYGLLQYKREDTKKGKKKGERNKEKGERKEKTREGGKKEESGRRTEGDGRIRARPQLFCLFVCSVPATKDEL